jgi:cleavage stimulation factor subunit 2
MDPQREKAMRSIFVANIAFETTEDELKAVLCEVGPVVNLKLIQDPVTGKSRGFGFCEYEDTETALSACRNLVGREVNGRPLRIDSAMNAPGDSFRGPPGNPQQQGPVEPPLYGQPVPPESAPEAITKAVASLPPEQMYELMKQIKWCIQYNPREAKQLLLQNPQLAYALLQAQVVMRIVDLDTAQNLLHRNVRAPPMQAPPPQRDYRPHPPERDWQRPTGGPPPSRGRGRYMPPPPPPPPQAQEEMSHEEHEKAALLVQVLSLTDEQIQMLPPEQRNNILRLKEQLSHTN